MDAESNPLLDDLEADLAELEGDESNEEAEAEIDKDATPATDVAESDLTKHPELKTVYKLLAKLQPVLDEIARLNNMTQGEQMQEAYSADSDQNPTNKAVVDSNSLAAQIDDEMVTLHKFIADRYSTRFPGLDTLVNNRVKYISTVAIIGNGPFDQLKVITTSTDNPVGKTLREVLDGPTVMNVHMEAAISKGEPLDSTTLELLVQACKIALELNQHKTSLTEFVQKHMPRYAPDLTALIGAEVAAQLVNAAGGLKKLANIPASNLAAIGNNKQRYGAANLHERQGFLYFAPIIQDVPTTNRQVAIKRLTGKVTLAARTDAAMAGKQFRDGAYGRELRQQVLDQIDKLTEVAPNRGVRALPVPDDKPSKKRGGKKARAEKNRNAYTELRQAQNRMAFGQEEQEVSYGDESVGMGMIGGGDAGRIRAFQVDERTKAKLSKKHPGWGAPGNTSMDGGTNTILGGAGRATGLRTSGVNTMGGTRGVTGMSTLNFSAKQGLVLANPDQFEAEVKQKRALEADRYFKGGSFSKLGNGTDGSTCLKRKADGELQKEKGFKLKRAGEMELETDKDGFKKPALPMLKRFNKMEKESNPQKQA